MSIDVGLRHRIEAVPGFQAWHVSAGAVSLTALEDGNLHHWPEPHVFVLNDETGHLMIDGSLGTFCHSWPSFGRAKGESLASFLTKVGFDYFMTKAAKQPWREVDVPASILRMRTETLRDRRAGYIEAKVARDVWDDLRDLDDHMSEGELLNALVQSGILYDHFVSDGGPSFVMREVVTARRFWDEVWASFRTQVLLPTIEAEASARLAA